MGEAKAEATAAGETGRWEVRFPAQQANSSGQKLTVISGDDKIEMDNILIGEAISFNRPWPWFGVTESQAQEARHAYWAAIEFVDGQVGRLLQTLDRLKLTDKTIVVFWSDNGYHLGENGLWKKQSLFEKSARVPLIIAAPGQKSKGQPSPRTVELLDIYPTLADLCGLTPPTNLAGRSLRPLLDDPQVKWDKPAFSQHWMQGRAGHSVRTERWRYTEWDDGRQGMELYDYDKDPGEQHNLAHDRRMLQSSPN